MGVNNAKTIGKLRTLVNLGLDSQPFEKEHEWIKVGKTGVAHASSSCYKYNPSYSSQQIKFMATPLEVKKACADCFYEAFPKDVSERVSLASKVTRKMDTLELEKEHSARTSSALLLKAQSLKEALKSIADKEGLENFVELVNQRLNEAIEKFKAKSSTARQELTRLAACEYYAKESKKDAPNVSSEDDRILGFQQSNFASVYLYAEFRKLFVSGKTENEILSLLNVYKENFKLRDTDQLDFSVGEQIPLDRSLGKSVTELWEKKVSELVEQYTKLWYKDVQELIDYEKLALIAISDISDLEDSLTATVAAFIQARVKKSATILVPEIVANWISKCQTMGYNVKSNIYTGVNKSSLYPKLLEKGPELNEAALQLWEPYKNEVYQNYIDALKAASKL